jgi:ComF family protein
MRGTWLCERCLASIPPLRLGICFRCGTPLQGLCQSCAQLDPAIRFAKAAYPYTGWVGSAIRAFKYADERSRVDHLASLMVATMGTLPAIDVLVPVPLHAGRYRSRGYNQAELIANALGWHLGIPVQPLLVRSRETVSQVTLSRAERQDNLRGAFGLSPQWAATPGQHLVLIDDVRTTGATLNACARELQRTGPWQISAVTLALDLPSRELNDWLANHGS